MKFNSLLFLIYLPLVVTTYYHLSQRQRQWFILLASYSFYWVWSFKYSALLLVTTAVDYSVARWIDRSQDPVWRRRILWVSMLSNLALLAVFKYANFLSGSLAEVLGYRPWPELDLVLPLGISFYTFMSMAYVIDVYRRELPATRDFLNFALFISYFPHLVAGPILRARELLPQLAARQPLDWTNIRRGLALILWGMLVKVYIADAVAHTATEVYGGSDRASGFGLLMATYGFAVQIYCDFAGYSDIAIGSALLLGVRLPENFRQPYLSCSISEFWRRWHISLSSWLRDYLYIPLGGNRRGRFRTYANLMITMLLGGLWHGAGWHWVVWGGIQGVVMSIERLLGIREEHPRNPVIRAARWLITLHIVCLSWVFFRSSGIDHAWQVLTRIGSWAPGEYYGGLKPVGYLILVLLLDRLGLRRRWVEAASQRPIALRWIAYASLLILGLTFAGASNPEFIYFQF
jgi:alginate O-acetyltransferase complex protein AlgI